MVTTGSKATGKRMVFAKGIVFAHQHHDGHQQLHRQQLHRMDNEYEAEPENANQFSFGGLTITGNFFVCSEVAPWFRFIVVKSYGPGHRIRGLSVIGCFPLNRWTHRLGKVSIRPFRFEHTAMRSTFEGLPLITSMNRSNPLADHEETSNESTWRIGLSPLLPFGGNARWIESVQPIERITNSAGQWVKEMPYALANQGTNDDEIHLKWSEACKGTVSYVARMDNPE